MKFKINLIIISSIIIIIGLSIKIENNYKSYKINKKELSNINNYIYNKIDNEYLFILEIPKIKLKKGIKINDDVDNGIMLLDYNKYLLNDIIVASHSGNCDVCYFSRLDELNINDEIYIYREGIKYIYNINSILEEKKNTFKLADLVDTITLITCKKNTNDMQIIIKGKLVNEVNY